MQVPSPRPSFRKQNNKTGVRLHGMWKAVEPVLTQALLVLVPALVTFLAGWLRRRSQVEAVKGAIAQVEEESWDECPYSKKAKAVQLVNEHTNVLNQMPAKKVGEMVEKLLPDVKRKLEKKKRAKKAEQAQAQARSQDRRSVEVTFDDE